MSYDGQAYHQSAVYHLAKDFNPYFDRLTINNTQYFTYINHYPKISEIVSGCIYAFTDKIQSAKCFNFIFMISNILLGIYMIKNLLGFNKLYSYLFSLLIALNPVVITQVCTFYVDGLMYSAIIALIYSISLLIKFNNPLITISILLLSILLCNIKFTSLVYCIVLLFFATLFFLIYKKKKQFHFMIKNGLMTLLFGILAFGYNPYITNFKEGNHPFYPIYGNKKIDIITNMLPYEFIGKNRFEKFMISFLGETDNFANNPNKSIPDQKYVKLKIPLSISKNELLHITNPDLRISGFGPFFSGIFSISIICIAIIVCKNRNDIRQQILLIITFSIVLTIIINPEFWWARFSPQIWLLPIIIVMMLYRNHKMAKIKYISWASIFLISANVFLFLTSNIYYNLKSSLRIWKNIEILQSSKEAVFIQQNVFEMDFLKLKENNIKYKTTNSPLSDKYRNNLFDGMTIYQGNRFINTLLDSLN
ncbi:hypothetical protein [Chryseobacterium oryzae]|uniref:Glycosyltransferase RgtA/B/C/D-like domain-containing protein n=1 Tax=Chryseobacterium oryzae TaxID=2929799 RepID=A0ABY4BJW0_9FLAO|nr:hypothetical protein [Chryseobacterium oryzae]UOE38008.1 hypothetical protein MTP08_13290 [Chryseobacterium oryzae]